MLLGLLVELESILFKGLLNNFSDSFLFPAAFEDAVICRLVLECIIEVKIEELEIRVEYTKPYNSEFKCIRLDVYAKERKGVTNMNPLHALFLKS